MDFSIAFFQLFFLGVFLALPVLSVLCFFVAGLGLIVGRIEKWSAFNSLYWAFITALTVGYGDMRPIKKSSKIISIIIAWSGIMLTGLLVAIAVKTASIAFEKHVDPTLVRNIEIHMNRE